MKMKKKPQKVKKSHTSVKTPIKRNPPTPLRFDDLESLKLSFQKIIKQCYSSRISDSKSRTLGYLVQCYIGILRFDKDCDLEKRIDEIEKFIREKKRLELVG